MVASRNERLKAIAVVLPSLAAVIVFVYVFIGWTVRTSFSQWRGIMPDYTFVGWSNYAAVLSSPRFMINVWNTLFFTAAFLALTIALGLTMAYLLDRGVRGENFFRTVYLFPMAISFVVTGVAWRWIFNPTIGINALLASVGLDQLIWGWHTDPTRVGPFHLALIPVIIAASWQLSGYTMAMFLAGLRGIPGELVEQARIDGGSEFFIFRKVLLPLLKPIVLSAMIVLGHFSLKIFDLVYTMTGSGPAFSTDFPAIFMYETTFRANRYGQGAVIAVAMLVLVSVVIVPYLLSTFRKERV